jgi:hypothetical protein
MPLWKPSASFGPNEQLGRRLFDEPMLSGARDQKRAPRLELVHFEEERGEEYSLDRLGRTGVEKQVVRYLVPRCECHGKTLKPQKRIDGWATIKVKDLTQPPLGPKFPAWTLVYDPVQGVPPNDNAFHAHGIPPTGVSSVVAAFHLRHHFEKKGKIFDTNGVEIDFDILNAMPRLSLWKRAKVTWAKHYGRMKLFFAK